MEIAYTILAFMGGYIAFMMIVVTFVKVFFPFFTKEQLGKKKMLKLQHH